MINENIADALQNLKTLKERSSGKQLSADEALQFIQAQASIGLVIELNRFNNLLEDQMKIGGALDFRRR